MVFIHNPQYPAIKIDVDEAIIRDAVDSNLSDYLKIIVTDAAGVITYAAKAGDHRFSDVDDTDYSDVFRMTCDDANGSAILTTSCITDKNIFEIDHNGTLGAAADLKEIVIDLADIVVNDAATTAATLYGIDFEGGSVTATAVGLSTIVGARFTNPTAGEYLAERGIQIICDKSVFSNNAIALETSRDITGTLAAAETFTNYANIMGQSVTHSGGDFILTNDAGILQLNLNHDVTVATPGAPDVFSATALNIAVTSDVNVGTSNAQCDTSARALDISWTIAESDGIMRMAATDIARIVYTGVAGVTSAAGYEFNLLKLDTGTAVLDDTNMSFRGIDIELIDTVDTDFAVFYGINIDMPTAYQGTDPTSAIHCTGNSMIADLLREGDYGLYIDVDLAAGIGIYMDLDSAIDSANDIDGITVTHNAEANGGAVTHDGFFINYDMTLESDGANITRQTNPLIDLTVNLTETANVTQMTSGILNATIAAGATSPLLDGTMISFATTGSGLIDAGFTMLSLSQAFAHDGATADALQGIDVNWSGNVPQTTNDANLTLILADLDATIGSGVGGDAGEIYGIYSDFSGATINGDSVNANGIRVSMDCTDTDFATLYGVNVVMPTAYQGTDPTAAYYAAGNSMTAAIIEEGDYGLHIDTDLAASTGIYVDADMGTTANNVIALQTTRDMTGALTATTFTNYANIMGQSMTHSSNDAIATNDQGILQLVLNTDVDYASSNADVFSATALNIGVTSDMDNANADLDVTARAIDISYALSRSSAGAHNLDATDILRINFDVAAGCAIGDGGAGDVNMILLDGDGVVPGATISNNMNISALTVDWSSASMNDANTTLFGARVIMPAAIHTTAANLYGVDINADGATDSKTICLNTSRDMSGTLSATPTFTNYANVMGQAVGHTITDTVVTHDTGILQLNLTQDTDLATAAADLFSATALNIVVAADMDNANADIDTTARALDIGYTVARSSAGVHRLGSTDIARIVYTGAAGMTSAAGYELNLLKLDTGTTTFDDANTSFRAIDIELIDTIDTDFAVFYGINIDMPVAYQGTDPTSALHATGNSMTLDLLTEGDYGLYIDNDLAGSYSIFVDTDMAANTTNNMYGLYISKDASLDNSATGAISLTNYAAQLSVAGTNADDGGNNFTNSANVLEIDLSHNSNSSVGAVADTFDGTGLDIDITASTQNSATNVLTTTARALDINYTVNYDTAGTHTLGATDIARIDFNVAASTTIGGSSNILLLDGDGFLPGAGAWGAGYTIDGLKIDWSAASYPANGNTTMYGIEVIMPAAYAALATEAAIHCTGNGNVFNALLGDGIYLDMGEAASIGLNIESDTIGTVANAMQTITTSRDFAGVTTADIAMTNYSVTHSVVNTNTPTTDFDFDFDTGAGVMNLIMQQTNTSSFDKTDPDKFNATALNIEVDATTVTEANSELDAAPRAIDISYDISELAGTLQLGTTDAVRIQFEDLVFSTAGAMVLQGLNILVTNAETFDDVNITFAGSNIDLANITNTASTLVCGQDITMGTSADMGLRVTMGATPATGGIQVVSNAATEIAITTNGEIVAGNYPEEAYLPFEDFVTGTLTNCTVTKVFNAAEDELAFDIDNTGGGAGSAEIYFQFRIPVDFKEFPDTSDDITIRAIQDGGADIDATITIDFLDNAGTDADDDSVAATTLTNAWATYDCATVTGDGTWAAGDAVNVLITVALTDNDDDVQIIYPKVLYKRSG